MAHWQGKSYFATLGIRPSEMNGLEYLPGASKDRLLPVVLLAPWVSAKTLDQAMERFEKAYPGRSYILDIDRDYYPTDTNRQAQFEWLSLRDSERSFANWISFIKKFPQAIPCLQIEGQDGDSISRQIDEIQSMGREFCFRVDLSRRPANISDIVDVLVERGTADYSVILEGGWVLDALSFAPIFLGIINGVLSPLDGRTPVVASCTTMKKEFSSIDGLHVERFSNRLLVDQIRQSTNRSTIIYGDWGSTRPREVGMGRTPLPRIDYPCDSQWLMARSKPRDWSFSNAAREITLSSEWNGNLGIWGEDLIAATATGDEFAIDSPQKNVAARVNIHLHRQAQFGSDLSLIPLDEPWVD